MTLRDVSEDDYINWYELWEKYNLFYKRSISEEISKLTWARILDPNFPMFSIVAELDGEIIGFTNYLFHPHTALLSDTCYLQDLFTVEPHRGKRVGRSLIEEVSRRAKERGSVQMYWMTHESNKEARILYDKIAKHSGFIVYSRKT